MMKTGHFEFVYPATPRRLRTRTNKEGTVFFIFRNFFLEEGGYWFFLSQLLYELAMTGFLNNYTMLKF